jgi:hypothetical protein
VTDPFLRSDYDDESGSGTQPVGRIDELARKSGLPRSLLDTAPAEILEDIAEAVARAESWSDLADSIYDALEAAGFHQHDPYNAEGGGGFHINTILRDDGILVSWASRRHTVYEPGSFEVTVERMVQTALLAILVACGFEAEQIPDEEDFAGYILVSGLGDEPGLLSAGG